MEQRILEQASRLPADGAVTGWAALRVHGVTYCDGTAQDGRSELPVPLVMPTISGVRHTTGCVVHRDRLASDERLVVKGIPITTPTRATFDAARRAATVRDAVAMVDLSLSAGVVDRDALAAYLETRAGWRGLRQVQWALLRADDRCLSPKESTLRMIWCLDAGYPPPRSNWPVADAARRFIGRPDLLSTDLGVVGEYDGAEHRSRARQRDDVRRDEEFRRVGLEPFRVVGADLADVARVVARMRSAVERARHLTPTYLIHANPPRV